MMRDRSAVVILTVLVLLVAASCADTPVRDDNLGFALERQARELPIGTEIEFSDLNPEPWTRVAIFPAYSTDEQARSLLGFDYSVEGAPGLSDDGGYLLIFVNDDAVAKWFTIRPESVGFDGLTLPVAADRPFATTSVTVDASGYRFLSVEGWESE